MKISLWQLTSLLMIVSLTLASCTSAPAPVPTGTPLPPTAPPTQTATATLPPTLTPTETQVPNPWIELLAGRGEYVIPTDPIELGVETAKDLKINPNTSPKAVYDEIVGSLVKQLELPENKYIWDQMVLEHPEWAAAPAAINSTNAGDYSQMRKDMMQRFLQLSKGLLHVKLWPSNEVKLTDLSKPVVNECEPVDQVPTSADMRVLSNSEYMAYGVYVNSEGQLTYRIEMIVEQWQNGRYERGFFCSGVLPEVIENQARGKEFGAGYMKDGQKFVDFRPFAVGLQNIEDLLNDVKYRQSFLVSNPAK